MIVMVRKQIDLLSLAEEAKAEATCQVPTAKHHAGVRIGGTWIRAAAGLSVGHVGLPARMSGVDVWHV